MFKILFHQNHDVMHRYAHHGADFKITDELKTKFVLEFPKLLFELPPNLFSCVICGLLDEKLDGHRLHVFA